jgi:hypothetical protein
MIEQRIDFKTYLLNQKYKDIKNLKKKVQTMLTYNRAPSSRPVSTLSGMSNQSQNPLKLIYRTSMTLENGHTYQVYLFEIH